MAQGARPVGDLVTRFDTYPGLEQYTVDIDNYSVVDGPYLYFDLPFTPSLAAGGRGPARPADVYLRAQREHRAHGDRVAGGIPPSGHRAAGARTSTEPDGGGTARITTSRRAPERLY